MEAVHGRDVLLELKVDGVYYPVLCGTDCTFTREPEFLESTNPTSGIFKRYIVRREDWSMNVSGLTKIENDASLTFFYLLQTSVRRATQTVRITFEDIDSNSIQIEGTVLIGNETISGPVSDFASCSIEFKGNGAFTVGEVTPPTPGEFDWLSDYWSTVNGNNYVDLAGSSVVHAYNIGADDELLEVDVEGVEFDIITSGTPGNRQCKLNTSTFVLTFASDLIFDGNQKVFVEFKRTL